MLIMFERNLLNDVYRAAKKTVRIMDYDNGTLMKVLQFVVTKNNV